MFWYMRTQVRPQTPPRSLPVPGTPGFDPKNMMTATVPSAARFPHPRRTNTTKGYDALSSSTAQLCRLVELESVPAGLLLMEEHTWNNYCLAVYSNHSRSLSLYLSACACVPLSLSVCVCRCLLMGVNAARRCPRCRLPRIIFSIEAGCITTQHAFLKGVHIQNMLLALYLAARNRYIWRRISQQFFLALGVAGRAVVGLVVLFSARQTATNKSVQYTLR